MANNFITGLDIGSKTIKAVIAVAKKDGQLSLLRVLKVPSAGMRKGTVDELPELVRALNHIFSEIKNFSKHALKNIFLNVGGANIHIQSSRGIVAVSRADFEIHKDDADRVVQAAQAINLPSNRMVLHAITREYIVDGAAVKDPMGMTGNRLEVNSLIIDAFSPAIKNLTKAVESAGANPGGLIFGPLAAARSILSKNQKDLGVVLVDIGFGTTNLCVYEENKLLHAAVLPVGSGNVTNDLAIGLKTSIAAAEAMKLSFGSATSRGISARETIDLKKIDPNSKTIANRKYVSEIIEVRLAEIFEFVNNELKIIDKSGKLPAGIVLVGGGSKMPNIVDLAKQELKLPAQVGIPDTSIFDVSSGELSLQAEDPEIACALGLVLWASDGVVENVSKESIWGRIKSSLLP
ncbi:MAG: Cell division protein ftsA [Parcubacteria group bacterium Athens1014_26]|nr:MAG: Cell division protein ftsA [Parcubacteria group bacterium Athens1014_26]